MPNIIAGNYENKLEEKNVLAKFFVARYLRNLNGLLARVGSPRSVVELGAGEGYLTRILCERFPQVYVEATDLSPEILKVASGTLKGKRVVLSVQDAERLSYADRKFDLLVCCEVLEHVAQPERALAEIRRVTDGRAIFSVPQEPMWRIMNVVRGRYWRAGGNTPGHANHWSRQGFISLVQRSGFRVLADVSPFPWTMLLVSAEPAPDMKK